MADSSFQPSARAVARCLVFATCTVAVAAPAKPKPHDPAPTVPLQFAPNTGHWPKEVQFVARSGGGTLFRTRCEAVLTLRKGDKATALRLKLQGCSAKAIASGLEKQPGIVNYFLGKDPAKRRTNVATYSRVKLADVYPVVDLATYGTGRSRTLEYGFVVRPGAGKLTVTAGDMYILPYAKTGKRGVDLALKAYGRSLPDYAIQPDKSITFRANGSEVGTSSVAADGWASATWAIPAGEATGAHTAAAGFAGDAWYKALTATTGFNVVP